MICDVKTDDIMPSCVQCKRTEAESTLVSCDNCGSKYCQDCSSLTATEIRAIAVKTRVIRFFCQNCSSSLSSPTASSCATQDGFAGVNSTAIRESIADLLGPLCDRISTLETEIKILKTANTELIELITNKPQVIRDKKSRAQDNAENCKIVCSGCADKVLKETIHVENNNSHSSSTGQLIDVNAEKPAQLKAGTSESLTASEKSTRKRDNFVPVKSRRKNYPRECVETAQVPLDDNVRLQIAKNSKLDGSIENGGGDVRDDGDLDSQGEYVSGWRTVAHRRSRPSKHNRPEPMRGSNSEDCSLRTAPSMAFLFVSGLAPDVASENLVQYLKNKGLEGFTCDKMKTRKEKYRSSLSLLFHALTGRSIWYRNCGQRVYW